MLVKRSFTIKKGIKDIDSIQMRKIKKYEETLNKKGFKLNSAIVDMKEISRNDLLIIITMTADK